MVAHTDIPPASEATADEAWARESAHDWHKADRGGLRRLVASTVRLADLQLKIWLTRTKIAVSRILTAILLFTVAGVMAILGTIFLFIGLFRVLTDVVGLRPVWAFLIFALVMFSITAGVLFYAKSLLSKKAGEPDKKKPLPEKPR